MHVRRTLKPSPLQPILALVPEALPTKEEEKNKFLSFELKTRAGQPAGSTTYKKYVRVFEEGTPYQWIELVKDLSEIWTQNSVNGPTDRTATIRALLKGESLTAFETALEDVRVNPDPEEEEPLQLTIDLIEKALAQVAQSVFPHRALETALEDVRVNPDPEEEEPLQMTIEIIKKGWPKWRNRCSHIARWRRSGCG